jgi:hypothetical protein
MNSDLERRILESLLGKPLVMNAFRGTLVEAMLAQVLEPEWRWCAADWASHDFENSAGVRLEVKQSSALQSWHEDGFPPNRGRFDIAPRKIRWEGARRIEEAGRHASVYAFAWHPVTDVDRADHRDAGQWEFYIVSSDALPPQKTIARSRIAATCEPVGIADVPAELRRALG